MHFPYLHFFKKKILLCILFLLYAHFAHRPILASRACLTSQRASGGAKWMVLWGILTPMKVYSCSLFHSCHRAPLGEPFHPIYVLPLLPLPSTFPGIIVFSGDPPLLAMCSQGGSLSFGCCAVGGVILLDSWHNNFSPSQNLLACKLQLTPLAPAVLFPALNDYERPCSPTDAPTRLQKE